MDLTDQEVRELRTMLAAFKAGLPSHDLTRWQITRNSAPVVIEGERLLGLSHDVDRVEIRGWGQCGRCHRRFYVPEIHTFTTAVAKIDATVEKAKARVMRLAETDGPCWGSVPTSRDESYSITLSGRLGASMFWEAAKEQA